MFLDRVKIWVSAGAGGDGAATFRREAHVPRGGPDGGDGGRGGSVLLRVDPGQTTLRDFRFKHHFRATNGGRGERARRHGAAGDDLMLDVPPGTAVYEDESDALVADLVMTGQTVPVARGGRGGLGNTHFKTSTHQAPKHAQKGEPGQERWLRLELRLIADIGLVGLPNAGKSTLLAAITAARPKIADYPFTTLSPNLGVADVDDGRFVVADIPGLIGGASEGRGLGHRFLRHVSRCRALVLVVDLATPDPSADLGTLRTELGAYDEDLLRRPSLVVGTKTDLAPGVDPQSMLGAAALGVSAVAHEGIDRLQERIRTLAAEASASAEERRPYVVLRPARPRFAVTREGDRFRVVGRGVERLVAESDLDDPRTLARLQRRLVKEGVERELAAAGARRGDEVVIGAIAFEFLPGEEIGDGTA
jgi:GTP-binding protein